MRSYYYDTVLNIYQLLYLLTVYNHISVLQNYYQFSNNLFSFQTPRPKD
jgi:hypothetical protein